MGRLADTDRTGKKQDIKKLLPHHRQMVWLIAQGVRPGELARMFGLSLSQVSRIVNSEPFREYLAQVEKRIEAEMLEAEREKHLGWVKELLE